MDKPKLIERFANNGEHSHWELRHPDTNDLLWGEVAVTNGAGSYSDSDICIEHIKRSMRSLGGRVLIIGTGVPDGELFDRVQKSFPEFIREYPLVPEEAFIPATMPPKLAEGVRKRFETPDPHRFELLDPDFEESSKKTYKEPPWKFNKPHNHTSEPYGKSNRSCRTARKRKNNRN